MSGFPFTLGSGGGASSLPAADRISAVDRMFGRDLWLDVSRGDNVDLLITPAKDWQVVAGLEALRQSLLRRLVTNPGEWATLPDYGVGARQYVKRRNTRANRDELANRIRSQFLRDPRVEEVTTVVIDRLPDATGIRITVDVKPRGTVALGATLTVQAELT